MISAGPQTPQYPLQLLQQQQFASPDNLPPMQQDIFQQLQYPLPFEQQALFYPYPYQNSQVLPFISFTQKDDKELEEEEEEDKKSTTVKSGSKRRSSGSISKEDEEEENRYPESFISTKVCIM